LSHSGERKKVHHPEVSADLAVSLRKRRSPTRFSRQVTLAVELKQPDYDFTDNAAADGPQTQAVFHHLCFLEDVVPKRRRLIEIVPELL
jgi:hypothetical protein